VHLVVLVHGINTRALWIHTIKPALEDAGFVVAPTSYGKFGVPRFLLPFYWLRRKSIERVVTAIVTAQRLYNPSKVSVICHSFGTYVVAQILAEHPELKWHRIVFCGSVVRDDFPLHQYLERFDDPLLNEVGTKDFWPALAESVTWGYGSVGSNGFNAPPVESRWHIGFRHSDFLTDSFCKKFWIPFLKEGKTVRGDVPTALPWWIRFITGLPLRWLWPVLFAFTILSLGALLPGDTPARSAENPKTRLVSFNINLPNESFEPGLRYWTRPTLDRWLEKYPNGIASAFEVLTRIHVSECDGTIVVSQKDPTLQLFIPDSGCEQMVLKWRRKADGWLNLLSSSIPRWNDLARMQDVQEAANFAIQSSSASKADTPQKVAIQANYQICVGEHRSRCPPGAIHLPCGASVAAWAKNECDTFGTAQVSSFGGNRCGYSVVQVTCMTTAK
jgi:pimeloyl-ACP methyl ester carboxylesterase